MYDVWAIVPVKDFAQAKQRLAGALSPDQRRSLAAAMLEDVLRALVATPTLAGIRIVTRDPSAARLAARFGAHVTTLWADRGYTAAVTAAAHALAREGRGGMLVVPGDVPLVSATEIGAILSTSRAEPTFSIVPAHDGRGTNAVLCSPPDAVPLLFDGNSFHPHQEAARRRGIEPTVVRLPGLALDIDNPVDLGRLIAMPEAAASRTCAYLRSAGVALAIQPQDA
jgi:2-phospho-L-lactate guanylyltransferase